MRNVIELIDRPNNLESGFFVLKDIKYMFPILKELKVSLWMTDLRSFLRKYPIDYIFPAETKFRRLRTKFKIMGVICRTKQNTLFINTNLISQRNLWYCYYTVMLYSQFKYWKNTIIIKYESANF